MAESKRSQKNVFSMYKEPNDMLDVGELVRTKYFNKMFKEITQNHAFIGQKYSNEDSLDTLRKTSISSNNHKNKQSKYLLY
jgi:hypothetical protein